MPDGSRRPVETDDIASVLLRMENGVSGAILLNRSAWGRKGRIAVHIFGSKGTVAYDQERLNEVQLYQADDPAGARGFRTILTGTEHPPYDRFIPAPGHSLGFNDLKVIEAHELIRHIEGAAANLIDFETGIAIERTVAAIAQSFRSRGWIEVRR